MKRGLAVVLMIAWGLWIGGLVALLIFVTMLFKTNRPIALEAAPVLFRTFAAYQLMVGLVACAGGTLLAIITRRRAIAALTLVLLGSLAAGILLRGVTNQMEHIRMRGESSGPEFRALHGKSSMLYTASGALLLIAGAGFTLVLPSHRTSPGTAPV